MKLWYRSWLKRPCCVCGTVGAHLVVFGRPRCVDCRREDLAVIARANVPWLGHEMRRAA